MITATYWWEDASWEVEERELHDVMLLAPLKGGVAATVAGEQLIVDSDSFLLIPEGVPHALRTAPGEPELEQVALHLYLESTWRPPLLPLFQSPVQRFPTPAPVWHQRLVQVVSGMNHKAFGQAYGALLIRELLVECLLAGVPLCPPNEEIEPRIAQALKTIHRDYPHDLTVRGLADQARLSTVQFRKLFQRHLHCSPKQYILKHRLKMATQLLRSSSETVQRIAYESGFNSEAYFHRCFRRVHGCTPIDYRAGRNRQL